MTGDVVHDPLVDFAQVARASAGISASTVDAGRILGLLERIVERPRVDAQHDPPVHGDEPTVGVVGEALVAGLGGQALDRRRR